MRCMENKNNTSDANDCLLDVIVGIKPEVTDFEPYLKFLSQYGTQLTLFKLDKYSKFRKTHEISMYSTREQHARLEEYWDNNQDDPIIKNIQYFNGIGPIDDMFD